MNNETSALALLTSREQKSNRNQKSIPDYLYPGDPYNIQIGISSVKKNLIPFNFDAPPIEADIVGRALVDYLKNIDGTSLSAVQLGFNFQSMILKDYDSKFMLCFNPIIVWESAETATADEQDLSFPGVTVKITRPYKIRVRYRDVNGTINTKPLEGAVARFFQHEYDRNRGQIFWMRADSYHRAKAIKEWKQAERKLRNWTKMLANVQ